MGNAQAAPIYTIANQKGGAGKTGIAANLAVSLASSSPPTLAIDLDPQGSLTRQLAFPAWQTGGPGTHDVLLRRSSIVDALTPSQWGGDDLAVLAGGQSLTEAGERLVATPRREDRLRAAIDDLSDDVTVVIDTPADLGTLTANALAATRTLVIAPVSARDVDSVQGLLESVALLREITGDDGPPVAALLTMVQEGRVVGREIAAALGALQDHGVTILSTVIPHATAFQKAGVDHRPVVDRYPDSLVASVFRELVAEVQQLTTETPHHV